MAPEVADDEPVQERMDAGLIAQILWVGRRLRSHEHWSRAELQEHRDRELEALRQYAWEHSAF